MSKITETEGTAKTHARATEPSSSIRHVDAAPTEKSPDVPADFDPTTRVVSGGLAPLASQRRLLPGALSAVKEHGDTFTRIVGPQGPRADVFAGHVALVVAWFLELRRAKAWTLYVNAQARAAWSFLVGEIEEIRPIFDLAARRDPTSIADLQPLIDFMSARSKVGIKAATTRRDRLSGKATKAQTERLARTHEKQRVYQAKAARAAALGAAIEAELKAEASAGDKVHTPGPTNGHS